jgi:hypothetical protein
MKVGVPKEDEEEQINAIKANARDSKLELALE